MNMILQKIKKFATWYSEQFYKIYGPVIEAGISPWLL